MAMREIMLKAWLREVAKHGLGEGFNELQGPTVADAGERLGISVARVKELVAQDKLHAVAIMASNGVRAVTLVTEASVAAREASTRREAAPALRSRLVRA